MIWCVTWNNLINTGNLVVKRRRPNDSDGLIATLSHTTTIIYHSSPLLPQAILQACPPTVSTPCDTHSLIAKPYLSKIRCARSGEAEVGGLYIKKLKGFISWLGCCIGSELFFRIENESNKCMNSSICYFYDYLLWILYPYILQISNEWQRRKQAL